MKGRIKTFVPLTLLICGSFAGSAAASAFYNNSSSGQPSPMKLEFSCGIFCHNTFNITAGGGASRPGKGGSFWLDNVGGFTGQSSAACDTGSGHPNVQDHGWAVLQYQGGAYQWSMYGDNTNPISGSPFRLDLGTFHGLTPGPPGCY